MRTRTVAAAGHGSAPSARCASTTASSAAAASANTAKNPSPSTWSSWPPCAASAARISSRCRDRTGAQPEAPRAWTRRVEPSTSVNRNVTSPVGRTGVVIAGPGSGAGRGAGHGTLPASLSAARRGRRGGGGRRPRAGPRARHAAAAMRIASKSHEAMPRQCVGSTATTCAFRGAPSITDSSPKNSPGPSSATDSSRPGSRAPGPPRRRRTRSRSPPGAR